MISLNIEKAFAEHLEKSPVSLSSELVPRAISFSASIFKRVNIDRFSNIISNQALSSEESDAVQWAASISNDDFYTNILSSASERGEIILDTKDFTCRHSLTLDYSTWLIGQHPVYGNVLVLQSNYAYEAVLFDCLSLYVIQPQGIGQDRALGILIGQLQWPIHKSRIARYLSSSPRFAGINLSYPSPFHNITFGHTGLLSLHMKNLSPRTAVHILKGHTWFDPTHLFPSVVSSVSEFEPKGQFIELSSADPVFFCKVGHLYRTAAIENRMLDIAFLASSVHYSASLQSLIGLERKPQFCVWVGLTSGKRLLVNESSIILATLEQLEKRKSIEYVFIDGWTGSSCKSEESDKTVIPALYAEHDTEALRLANAIEYRFPNARVKSLVGFTYEHKVAAALLCKFSITSAYTSSFVPARVCSLPGVIHSSNSGRPTLNMHIWRKSSMVPESITIDVIPNSNDINPLDYSYEIVESSYADWLSKIVTDKVSF